MRPLAATLLGLAIALSGSEIRAAGAAQSDRAGSFLRAFHAKPDNFAKFLYARQVKPGKDAALRSVAAQMLATELSILGRPGEAERAFAMGSPRAVLEPLPTREGFASAPALDYVIEEAKTRQVVMVNEAHHRPQTRLLTLALLPKLRAAGFTHFAAEALDEEDQALASRGYPTDATGFYTGEPLYGEIVRQALRLGYTVIPYEATQSASPDQQARETEQARNLFRRVFERDPKARLFVHAGYAHIDRAPGQLPGYARPMALEFRNLTGIAPLTVDQATLSYGSQADAPSVYRSLLAEFAPREPSVLVSRSTGKAWSFRPLHHHATVLLPDPDASQLRPEWLGLDGARRRVELDVSPCLARLPCLVEARYAAEKDVAIPADQYVMLDRKERTMPLYLYPGEYRIRLRGRNGVIAHFSHRVATDPDQESSR